jgi:hypothetical protein
MFARDSVKGRVKGLASLLDSLNLAIVTQKELLFFRTLLERMDIRKIRFSLFKC